MKLKAILGLIICTLLVSCETRKFNFEVRKTIYKNFVIDYVEPPFNECIVVTENDILGELNLPETATITSVKVSSNPRPRILITPLNELENQASTLLVSGFIKELGASNTPLWTAKNYPVVLKGVNVPTFGLNSLVNAGISKLAQNINDYLNFINTSTFEICINGDSFPTQRLRTNVQLELWITVDIMYEECIEMFLDTSGEDC